MKPDGSGFEGTNDYSDPEAGQRDLERGEKDDPVLLDLDGDGVEITSLDKSTRFVDAGGQGLKHRTAWAGNGDGVLFIETDTVAGISNSHEYIFTEWDASAKDDMAALRSAFDTNGDGKLTSADTRWNDFRVLVTNPNGSTTVKNLAELSITEINLKPNATHIDLPDGSVITGQATFIKDGVARTAANVSLVVEAMGARVTETATVNGSGVRTVVNTGLGEQGERLFVVTSVTAADGGTVTNHWDMNGDGVTERVQRITTVVDAVTGLRTETEQNWEGANSTVGVKGSRTVTATSANGKEVTISRDHAWGGWFDEREVHETAANGDHSVRIEQLARNGAVISATKSVVLANGLERTFYENIDGAGVTGGGGDEIITKTTISQDAAGARTESVVVRNADTSLRGSETLLVSANGLSRTTTTDLNGDGTWDVKVADATVQLAGGGTSTEVKVWNFNSSLRGQVNSTVSADGLMTTKFEDIDGVAGWERKTTETVVIDGAGQRTTTVHVKNTNDSTNSLTKTVLGADKVAREEWVDLNGDGTFAANEMVLQVTVEAGTNDRLTSAWTKAPNGTVLAVATDRTTQDGLSSTRTLDTENDGDLDRYETDQTVLNAGAATRTVTVRTGDQSNIIAKTETTVSADALTVTTKRDTGGDDAWDAQEVMVRSTSGGAVTEETTVKAGNGTVLGRTTTITTADRLKVTVTADVDGIDAAIDLRSVTEVATNGSRTITDERFNPNATLAAKVVTEVSANGLTRTISEDVNGDGVNDRVAREETSFAANGARTTLATVKNGDGSLRYARETVVSDDGLTTTVRTDRDGDVDANGTADFDHRQVKTTVLAADGSRVTTVEERTYNAQDTLDARLSQMQTIVSDDGLVTTEKSDADGDGDFDLVRTTTITILGDGTQKTVSELRELDNDLRSKTIVTVSDDGRNQNTTEDVNGDGAVDRTTARVVADTGAVTTTVTDTSATGAMQARRTTVVSANGLLTTETQDVDGDGVNDRSTVSTTVHLTNGSRQTTVEEMSGGGAALGKTVTLVSADGWETTTTRDIDTATELGVDFTDTVTRAVSADGKSTVTTQLKDQNGVAIRTETVETSADRREVTTTINLNDGSESEQQPPPPEQKRVATLLDSGSFQTVSEFRSSLGTLVARNTHTVSDDGLQIDERRDENGDGTVDRVATEVTSLSADGSVQVDRLWRTDRYVTLAATSDLSSDDGLRRTTLLDLNGDGVFESRGETETVLEPDGDVVTTRASFDGAATPIGLLIETVSGNGLRRRVVADYTGDGNIDRITEAVDGADGAKHLETHHYGADARLLEAITVDVRADGRETTTLFDLDGDGDDDRRMVVSTSTSRDVTTIWEDFQRDGDPGVRLTETRLANGTGTSLVIDRDADGLAEVGRTVDVSTEANGDQVTTRTETYAPLTGTLAAGRVAWREITTTSGDGLTSTTTHDVGGDGLIDGTTVRTTTYAANGARTDVRQTTYADGSLREKSVSTLSRDGLIWQETSDFDGNGIADRTVSRITAANGIVTETETSFNAAGVRTNVFVTTTSADGLVTRILRSDAEQVITHSPTGNGSYRLCCTNRLTVGLPLLPDRPIL